MQLIEQKFVVRRLEDLLASSDAAFQSAFHHFQDALILVFRQEEEDMVQLHYDQRDIHMAEHQKLLQLLWRISARLHYHEMEAAREMAALLPQCLLEHMVKIDRPLQQTMAYASSL
ncbi:hemerythrin [Herbaspirillum seropedicae]|uniref:hypothetical protein n=1 Tax=Herbaspirillum seropedicae TaxID=964 RepID=UPI00339B42BF